MDLIPPNEAWRRLSLDLAPLPSERVPRREALGRVLAEELAATVDAPANDVSAMDGYAIAAAVAPGETRQVAGTIAAGDPPGFVLPTDRAARIMTGAPAPPNTFTVIPVEQTDRGDDLVRFDAAGEPGQHIRRQGEVLRAGAPLLAAGTLLTPGAISLIATHGHSHVTCHRRPRVSFLTTGDEVVSPDREPEPGQLRDSHTDFLLAAGKRLGLDFEHLGIAPDDPEVLETKMRQGLSADVLLVCGGVSQGEFDFVESILERLGCRTLFNAVQLQPGKPLVGARHDRGWLIGLPGNPASVMVTFWLFVRPLLRSLMGIPDGYLTGAQHGTLGARTPAGRGRDRFLPAEVSWKDGLATVQPVAPKGSHDQVAYARGSALLRIAGEATPGEIGDPCEFLPI